MSTRRELEVKGAPRSVDLDDVDDIIGLAAELRQRDEGRLDLSDLREVAEEVGIEARYVEPALDALRARRAAEARAAEERGERRRRVARGAGIALGVLAALAMALIVRVAAQAGTLEDAFTVVERTRAQWTNVVERQAAVRRRFVDVPADADRQAERDAALAGAENRVRIERRRYDEAAAAYNGEARGRIGGWAAGWAGLPGAVPTSDAVSTSDAAAGAP